MAIWDYFRKEISKMTALVPANNQVTVVPNGTRISKLDDLVSRYQSYFRQTAEGYVKLCAVVREAEEALGYNEALLNEFCTKVGLCRDGSKYRKAKNDRPSRKRPSSFRTQAAGQLDDAVSACPTPTA